MAGYIKKFQVKCDHELQFDWPNGTILVPHIRKDGFNFEIYSQDPDSYFSGWGDNFKEAEEKGWKKFQAYRNCDQHDFERRDYTNGVGFCKKCNLFKSKAFLPSTICVICKEPTNFAYDSEKNYYCKIHEIEIKDEKYLKKKKEWELFEEKMKKVNEDPVEREKFKENLKTVINALVKKSL